jgi:alginate O-acetyltransferase complex protein AlgI
MLFNSPEFILVFFPICFVLYWALRGAAIYRLSLWWLLIASCAFYFYGESHHPYAIVVSIGFNFGIGRVLRGVRGSQKGSFAWLCVGICANLLWLGIFKYANFVFEVLSDLHLAKPLEWHIALPIGISFFTFTQIAYLVDVYRRKATEYDVVSYALFVTFFPHLVAGPILHHAEMMPQFATGRHSRWIECLADGLPVFAIGLFKKTVVADTVAPVANLLFDQSGHSIIPTFFAAWLAVMAYAVQIYFDFSGYSDMAIGLARMLGIDLPINFNSPYRAISISDFWRRWHITLSRFLRDYLYIPLGGSRCGPVRHHANLLLTMVLGGIWHGAGWTFVLWGFLHGVYLILNRLWSAATEILHVRTPLAVAKVLTILLVIVAWVPFRARDMASTLRIWSGMAGFGGFALPSQWSGVPRFAGMLGMPTADIGITGSSALIVLLSLAATLVMPNTQQIMALRGVGLDSPGYNALAEKLPEGSWFLMRRNIWWAAVAGLVLGLGLRTIGDYSAFIYFQF